MRTMLNQREVQQITLPSKAVTVIKSIAKYFQAIFRILTLSEEIDLLYRLITLVTLLSTEQMQPKSLERSHSIAKGSFK